MIKNFFEPHAPVSSTSNKISNNLISEDPNLCNHLCNHNFIRSAGYWVCSRCGICEDRDISTDNNGFPRSRDNKEFQHEINPHNGTLIFYKDLKPYNSPKFKKLRQLQNQEYYKHTPWRHNRFRFLKLFPLDDCFKDRIMRELYDLDQKYTIKNTFYAAAALLFSFKIASLTEIMGFAREAGYKLKTRRLHLTMIEYKLPLPGYTFEELTMKILNENKIPDVHYKRILYWAKRIKKLRFTKRRISDKSAINGAIIFLYPEYNTNFSKYEGNWVLDGIRTQLRNEIKEKEGN